MAITVKMFAPAGTSPTVYDTNGNVYTIGSDGTVTVSSADIDSLLKAGFCLALNGNQLYSPIIAPAAANAALVFASAALSNGTMTIAAQPDALRPLQYVALAGTSATTGGSLVLTYVANDGATHVDTLSLVIAASASVTIGSTYGVASLTSQVVSGLTGGASPTIYGGTTAALAVPVPPGAQDITEYMEFHSAVKETTLGSMVTSTGVWTPHTAPNATIVPTVGYSYIAPSA